MTNRRDAVERALTHHGVTFAPPDDDHSSFLIHTGIGTANATLRHAEWYCVGLADAERCSRAKLDKLRAYVGRPEVTISLVGTEMARAIIAILDGTS